MNKIIQTKNEELLHLCSMGISKNITFIDHVTSSANVTSLYLTVLVYSTVFYCLAC